MPRSADLLPGQLSYPAPTFLHTRIEPTKLKVNYTPESIDMQALRNGAVIELVHLSPLERMVIHLDAEDIFDEVCLGDALYTLVKRWIQHICSTQLHKFVTSTRTMEPVSAVGRGFCDLMVLPFEAFTNNESISKAVRRGVSSLLETVTYEALTTTSRVAHYVAGNVANTTIPTASTNKSGLLPSRPLRTPKDIFDATPHAMESLTRGLQTAGYKVVIVPYREYRRGDTKSALTSVLKGIPVAIAAPASGAAEALSFALLATRNHVQPNVRKEEESSLRDLQFD
jgi:autophagy-related protein 2